MKLFIVVLCYRVPDLTIDCLRSLSGEIGRVPGTRVGLLENGSGGDSAERLRRAIEENGWGSWVELTSIEVNQGFSRGNNILIRPALASADPPEYVLLLNSDTIVWEHALDSLVDFMESHPRAGIAGSRQFNLDGTLRASPFRFPGIASEFDRGLRLGIVSKLLSPWASDLPKPQQSTVVDWVSGACMILRRTMLEEIGLLDEGLYTYSDDVDIALRAKKAGWETWYVTESRYVHLGGASTGVTSKSVKRRPAYWFQARRRLFLKSYGKVYTALADAAFLLGFALWRLRRWVQRKPDPDPQHMLIDSIRHSVFYSGFRLTEVENPSLKEAAQSAEMSGNPVGISS
jgi:N-acetylglucosaminyl-diphospho-decaprenol L-rhamnosyltransferase